MQRLCLLSRPMSHPLRDYRGESSLPSTRRLGAELLIKPWQKGLQSRTADNDDLRGEVSGAFGSGCNGETVLAHFAHAHAPLAVVFTGPIVGLALACGEQRVDVHREMEVSGYADQSSVGFAKDEQMRVVMRVLNIRLVVPGNDVRIGISYLNRRA